eukprot:5260653-Pyramimonas_sp.AAC.1
MARASTRSRPPQVSGAPPHKVASLQSRLRAPYQQPYRPLLTVHCVLVHDPSSTAVYDAFSISTSAGKLL